MYSLSFLAIGFVSFGLESAYFRFLYEKKYDKKTVFSTGLILQFFISTIFFIISTNCKNYLIHISGYSNHSEYFIMFFLIVFFDTISIIPMAWLRVNEKPLYYITINIIVVFIQSILVFYMFFVYKNFRMSHNHYLLIIYKIVNSFTDRTGYIFFSNVISSIINFLLVIPILFYEFFLYKFNKVLARKMLYYGMSIMFGTIIYSINENLDKILIKRFISDEINGAYSACYKISSFISLYQKVFRLGIEPFFFKKSNDSDAIYYYEEITYFFMLFGLIFYVLLCSNIPIFIQNIISKKYHSAISIIPIIMMGYLLLGIYTNLSILYKTINKPFVGTFCSLIGLFITLFFNTIFILISKKNFMIPAWGTFFSYGSMLFALYIWILKKFRNFFTKKIKNILFHLFLAIFTIFSTKKNEVEINFIYQFLYLFIIFIFEKKRLLNLFK